MGTIISLNAYSYNNIVSGAGGKLYVPVKPSSVVYAQFDHISGVAAKANQDGTPLTKIRILNSLINQMVMMKRDARASVPQNASERTMDSLITRYQGAVHDAVQSAKSVGYGLAGAMPEAGAVLSMTV